MGALWYDIADPEVVTVWERMLDHEVRLRDPLFDDRFGFAGDSEGSLIQMKDALTEGPGSLIKTKIRYQINSKGKAGDATLKGSEDSYKTATFNIYVDTIRNAVAVSSPIIQQWVTENTLDESRDALADWFATRFSFSAHLHAAGIKIITDAEYTLNNTIRAIDSNYILRPNGAAAGALTSADVFDIDVVNTAVRQLKLLRPLIRPAQTPLGPKYCCFLSPEQVHDLRRSDSVWFAQMKAALQGGRIDDNPVFTNALGESNGVLFFESHFVPPGLNSGETKLKDKTRRAWIGGAQALFMAFGRGYAPPGYSLNRFRWDRESEDYGHQQQVAATTITGIARPGYTKPTEAIQREHGVFVIETYADYGSLSATDVYRDWVDAGATIEA